MRTFIGKILLHPVTFSVVNFALLILAYSSFKATWFSGDQSLHQIHWATELWEGYGTIILGFGVALEERPSLMKIFGTQSGNDAYEGIFHDYGVIFVVMGVLIEILAWLVKIPNDVLNTENVEMVLMNGAAAAAAGVVILQFRFLFLLLKKRVSRS